MDLPQKGTCNWLPSESEPEYLRLSTCIPLSYEAYKRQEPPAYPENALYKHHVADSAGSYNYIPRLVLQELLSYKS